MFQLCFSRRMLRNEKTYTTIISVLSVRAVELLGEQHGHADYTISTKSHEPVGHQYSVLSLSQVMRGAIGTHM